MNDWRLSYPGTVFEFGGDASDHLFDEAPDLGSADLITEDFLVPSSDGVLFGADHVAGGLVTFAVGVIGDVRANVERMRGVWRGDTIRTAPGSVAELRADSGRVTFGRPRRFAADRNMDRHGVVRVTSDFATATDLWFSGEEQSTEVALIPPAGGGLVAPLSAPLATTASSDRSQVVTVAGELPTWPIVEVVGPITNPVVEVLGLFRWEFRTTLAFDQTLVIDARPFARTILRNGASIAGALTPGSTRLSQSTIPPGSHELVLRGTSSTGTPKATVRWRDAFHTP